MTNYFAHLSALRQNRIFTSLDTDETRERVSRILQPFRLLPNGAAAASHMDSLRLPDLTLNAVYFGDAQTDVPALEAYDVIWCVRGSGEIMHGRQIGRISPREGVFCPVGRPFRSRLADCEFFVVRIEKETFESYLDDTVTSALQPTLDLTQPPLHPWMSMVQALVSDHGLHALFARFPGLAREYEGLFLRLLLCGMMYGAQMAPAPTASPAAVRRAEEFMEANITETLTLPGIAFASGATVRTLNRTFQRFRGCSPMERLRELRLDYARQLLSAPDNNTSVADVACACGFAHLGRFSGAYLKRFHEHPSLTLRRFSS